MVQPRDEAGPRFPRTFTASCNPTSIPSIARTPWKLHGHVTAREFCRVYHPSQVPYHIPVSITMDLLCVQISCCHSILMEIRHYDREPEGLIHWTKIMTSRLAGHYTISTRNIFSGTPVMCTSYIINWIPFSNMAAWNITIFCIGDTSSFMVDFFVHCHVRNFRGTYDLQNDDRYIDGSSDFYGLRVRAFKRLEQNHGIQWWLGSRQCKRMPCLKDTAIYAITIWWSEI